MLQRAEGRDSGHPVVSSQGLQESGAASLCRKELGACSAGLRAAGGVVPLHSNLQGWVGLMLMIMIIFPAWRKRKEIKDTVIC